MPVLSKVINSAFLFYVSDYQHVSDYQLVKQFTLPLILSCCFSSWALDGLEL